MKNSRYTQTGSIVLSLVIINVMVFFFQQIMANNLVYYPNPIPGLYKLPFMTYWFGLTPSLVIAKFYIWQLVTYMFLHGDFLHILFNMYSLLLFGIPVEQLWGPKKFFVYYFFTGIGAGITIIVMNLVLRDPGLFIPTIGASGAVYGILLAFGMLFPETELLVLFFIPMKARYVVILFGGIELYMQVTSGGMSSISHLGHLGGLLFGIIYFLATRRRGIEFKAKKIKAVLQNELNRRRDDMTAESDKQDSSLIRILEKLKEGGPSSLTDDEFQHIKRMDILLEHQEGLCMDGDFNLTDDYCKKCDNYQACLMREIRKHL